METKYSRVTGRGSSSGTYSYQSASSGSSAVFVSDMPEEFNRIRVVFQSHGETHIPILKLRDIEAELLWSCLKRIAVDLKWDDRIIGEREASK